TTTVAFSRWSPSSVRVRREEPADTLRRELRFGDEAERGTRFDPAVVLPLVVRRDEDERGWIGIRAVDQAAAAVEAALLAEADVGERQIGTKRLGEPNRLLARRCNADDHHSFLLEEATCLLAEARTIVDDQAAQGPHEPSIAARRARSHGG